MEWNLDFINSETLQIVSQNLLLGTIYHTISVGFITWTKQMIVDALTNSDCVSAEHDGSWTWICASPTQSVSVLTSNSVLIHWYSYTLTTWTHWSNTKSLSTPHACWLEMACVCLFFCKMWNWMKTQKTPKHCALNAKSYCFVSQKLVFSSKTMFVYTAPTSVWHLSKQKNGVINSAGKHHKTSNLLFRDRQILAQNVALTFMLSVSSQLLSIRHVVRANLYVVFFHRTLWSRLVHVVLKSRVLWRLHLRNCLKKSLHFVMQWWTAGDIRYQPSRASQHDVSRGCVSRPANRFHHGSDMKWSTVSSVSLDSCTFEFSVLNLDQPITYFRSKLQMERNVDAKKNLRWMTKKEPHL